MESNKIDEHEKKLIEEYEDSLWRLIMYRYAKYESEILMKEAEELKNDPKFQPSAKEKERFNKMVAEFFKKQKNK